MYINVRKEMDFSDFERECWSGAENILARIAEEGKEEEFINLLNESFYCSENSIDNAPTLTEINDLLRFDSDWVLEQLDIDKVKKYDIDDLSGEPYYRAIENYLNDFAAYVVRRLEEGIKENGVVFDADGNIIIDD